MDERTLFQNFFDFPNQANAMSSSSSHFALLSTNFPIKSSLYLHAFPSSSSSPSHSIQITRIRCPKAKTSSASASLSANFRPSAIQDRGSSVVSSGRQENKEDEDNFQVITAIRSVYNDIVIVDTPNSRMLLLDSTHNVHSIVNKGEKWTGSYWDEFATLPAIVPKAPIALYGLGGGTAAHLMLDSWPSVQLEGWEIDETLIEKARDYLGLSDLEKHTEAGGILTVHIGDVLSDPHAVSAKYAGIVVDLFSDGKVLSQLQEVKTWLEMNRRLISGGRIMVNCGGIDDVTGAIDGRHNCRNSSSDEAWTQNVTMQALCKAFPGQLSWKRMPEDGGANYLALTGPLPDLTSWSAIVPARLSANVKKWRSCSPLP